MKKTIFSMLLALLSAAPAPAQKLILVQDGFSGGSVLAASSSYALEQATGYSLGGGVSSSSGYVVAGGFYPVGNQLTGVSISEGQDLLDNSLPAVFSLQACRPNPSSGLVSFGYQLPKASNVSLTVYNIAGQVVKRFDQGAQPAGRHRIDWNGSRVSAGIYFYRLKAGDFSATRKLMIVK